MVKLTLAIAISLSSVICYATEIGKTFKAHGYEAIIMTQHDVLYDETVAAAAEKALSQANLHCGGNSPTRTSMWSIKPIQIDSALGVDVFADFICP